MGNPKLVVDMHHAAQPIDTEGLNGGETPIKAACEALVNSVINPSCTNQLMKAYALTELSDNLTAIELLTLASLIGLAAGDNQHEALIAEVARAN